MNNKELFTKLVDEFEKLIEYKIRDMREDSTVEDAVMYSAVKKEVIENWEYLLNQLE